MKKSLRWNIAQYLEVKWWKRYLSDKDPDSYLQWKKEYWTTLLNEISDSLILSPEAQVMDAGCGPTGIFIALDKYAVTAIDPLLDKYAELPHFQAQKFPNVQLKKRTIEDIPLDKKYDCVFCLNAINHVSDIQLAYDKLAASTMDNGYLVVSIDAHKSEFLKKIFKALPGDALHPHQYNLKEYETFLTARGFKIRKTLLKTPGRIFDYYVQVAQKVV